MWILSIGDIQLLLGTFTKLKIEDFDLLLYCHKFNILDPKFGEILEGLVSNIGLPIGVLISQIRDDHDNDNDNDNDDNDDNDDD